MGHLNSLEGLGKLLVHPSSGYSVWQSAGVINKLAGNYTSQAAPLKSEIKVLYDGVI